MKAILVLLSAVCGLSVSPYAFAAERPSFDCAKAETPTEKATCKDGRLAQLDRAIDAAFRQLKKDLATVTDEIDDEQKEFLAQRDKCRSDVTCLRKAMDERRGALALEPGRGDARTAFIGRYENDLGWMIIRRTLKGNYWLYGQTADPSARWACDVGGSLEPVRRGVSVVEAGEEGNSRPVRLHMKGSALVIAEAEEVERRLSEHTCGYRGTVEGNYRRVKKLRE
jgi:uncharacterized protein YecT (DUF1311 family)